jgi:hypothetical protein
VDDASGPASGLMVPPATPPRAATVLDRGAYRILVALNSSKVRCANLLSASVYGKACALVDSTNAALSLNARSR